MGVNGWQRRNKNKTKKNKLKFSRRPKLIRDREQWARTSQVTDKFIAELDVFALINMVMASGTADQNKTSSFDRTSRFSRQVTREKHVRADRFDNRLLWQCLTGLVSLTGVRCQVRCQVHDVCVTSRTTTKQFNKQLPVLSSLRNNWGANGRGEVVMAKQNYGPSPEHINETWQWRPKKSTRKWREVASGSPAPPQKQTQADSTD